MLFFRLHCTLLLIFFVDVYRINKTPGYPVVLIPGDGGSRIEAKLTGKPQVVHYICSKKTIDFFDLWLNLELFAPLIILDLCTSSFGWPSVFYLHGSVSLVLFCTWLVIFRNHPGKHPLVDKVELEKIRRDKSAADLQKITAEGKRKKIPYWAIVTTPAIWGIWLAALGDLVAVQLIHTFSPLSVSKHENSTSPSSSADHHHHQVDETD